MENKKRNINDLILQWANDRGILENATPKDQMMKLVEEVGELSSAIQKDNQEDIIDAIGDCVVVLTILSEMYKMDLEFCVTMAYMEIATRTGKMVDGVFVKDQKKK
jgi:NTP pyrophosphatase (non-canonical NTP hydrolase)